jgi:hypothetical protein
MERTSNEVPELKEPQQQASSLNSGPSGATGSEENQEAVRKLLQFELVETQDDPGSGHGHLEGCLSCS